ncbi:MAG: branched-chain amino acid ABC transporter permease [Anaerolineae bacterium]|nr:branched-chain amino acid ABC transporter permease [Anaerolineae bacterium]MCO5192494.1 branched-chain amino acid ABC transporter permease [Anaerolineae bacterium]MCO5199897.1 branched-chain amino acid ABC transporter permease [Anaerolineae bacterium]
MLATWRRYKLTRWLALVLLIVLILLPLPQFLAPERKLVTNSLLFSFTQLFMLIWMASNWNAFSGFTGYVDFGHAVFFGLGAYGTGVLMVKLGVPFPIAVLGGAIVAAIFAFLIGSATLRLKGPYFSIAMLGTFVAMREIVRIIKPITGGGSGLTLPPYLNRPLFYYVTLIGMAIVVLLIWLMRRTQFGASLIAIREDEVGAEMRGINTTRHKITIFCLACFSTGIVGGLWAYQNTFIDPDIVFFESRTIELVMMTILGGLGTVAGPVVGATVLYWLRDIIWANFLDYHLIVQGIMLILIVLFVPEGIMGIIGDPDSTSLGRLWKKHFGQGEETEQPTTTTEVQS